MRVLQAVYDYAFSVSEADWDSDAESVRAIRDEVFVVEQGVSEDLEFDLNDHQNHHVIAVDQNGNPIGTGRISPTGKIGRMAVLKSARRKGVGSAILKQLVALAAAKGIATLTLSSQLHALSFYREHGFIEQGEVYQEAGIDHVQMTRSIN